MIDDSSLDPASLSFLIVDDDEFSRELAITCLKSLDVTRIATAANGKEALAYLETTEPDPDILLVDLSMPDMGGAEMLRHIAKRNFQGAAILVSGLEENTMLIAESAAKYQDINVLGRVRKPLDPRKLREALANAT